MQDKERATQKREQLAVIAKKQYEDNKEIAKRKAEMEKLEASK